MGNSLGMTTDIPRAKNIDFFADRHFDFAFDDVGERFMSMNMERSADTRLVKPLIKGDEMTLLEIHYQLSVW